MDKYSDEFKLMVEREYLSGPLGYELLVRKYEMKSHSQLSIWANIYKKHGAVRLLERNNEVYSVQFKLDVLSFMKRKDASLTETALHFGLTNPRSLRGIKNSLRAVLKAFTNRKNGQPCQIKRRTAKKANVLYKTTR